MAKRDGFGLAIDAGARPASLRRPRKQTHKLRCVNSKTDTEFIWIMTLPNTLPLVMIPLFGYSIFEF